MLKNILTFNEAKQIPIVDFLRSSGIEPVKVRDNELWYHSPFREERTPSFKVDTRKNLWYDHGTGEGGTILDLGARLFNCNLHEVPEKLSQGKFKQNQFSFHQPQGTSNDNKFKAIKINDLKSSSLIHYLNQRGIDTDLAQHYCQEVEFLIGPKKYSAIGFKNRSGGFELRNSWFKGSMSPKDVSIFSSPNSKRVCVLEGFIDFLSLRQSNNNDLKWLRKESDFIVLNPLNTLNKNLPLLQTPKEVVLFLDNDRAGKEAKESLRQKGISFQDASGFYHGHKDLNDFVKSESLKGKNAIQSERKKGMRL